MNKRSCLIYEFGSFRLEPDEQRLSCDGKESHLRPRLMALLTEFVKNAGKMLTTDELLDAVWPDAEVQENNLTVSVNGLRRIIGDEWIETIPGRGYRFAAKVTVQKACGEESSDCSAATPILGPAGGAVPLDSPFYIRRSADDQFHAAILRRDSFALLKGAHQVGKTSLLARGLQRARETGATVVLTDFQRIGEEEVTSVSKLLQALGEMIAADLDLKVLPRQTWNDGFSPSVNFERYLRREVLAKINGPLVWGLDELDRLFHHAYSNDLLGLFRSWHNLRALDPEGPWTRLTMALAYATEAHLLISDPNQSPFNVGTRLLLEDFTIAQVAEFNGRCGPPPLADAELPAYFKLVGGIPDLVHCGFYEISVRKLGLKEMKAQADQEGGPFGSHLRRMWTSIKDEAGLCAAVRHVLQGEPGLTLSDFHRLRSAGILAGDSVSQARARCEVYASYLAKRLL